jgi:hypothetical protein
MKTTIFKSNKIINVPAEHEDALRAIQNYNLNIDLYNTYLAIKGVVKSPITISYSR